VDRLFDPSPIDPFPTIVISSDATFENPVSGGFDGDSGNF